MDECNFRFQQIWHLKKNNQYKQTLKRFVFPTDRALFNTFQIDYKKYYEDGMLAAQEMLEWGKINTINSTIILDWGCGTGRVIRHIPDLKKDSICYGADIDCTTIQWCRKAIDSVYFDCIEQETLPYPSNYFHLVYGISVLTHISHTATQYWLIELKRVLEPNGIAIISTHGTHYFHQLSQEQKKQLLQEINNDSLITLASNLFSFPFSKSEAFCENRIYIDVAESKLNKCKRVIERLGFSFSKKENKEVDYWHIVYKHKIVDEAFFEADRKSVV